MDIYLLCLSYKNWISRSNKFGFYRKQSLTSSWDSCDNSLEIFGAHNSLRLFFYDKPLEISLCMVTSLKAIY